MKQETLTVMMHQGGCYSSDDFMCSGKIEEQEESCGFGVDMGAVDI